jgi:pSer/pThr/pTyr-binding forkhead associated (FHA) protein
MDQRVFLYLLDSPHGPPLQFWSFEEKDLIRIGRSPENDVVVPHPCVSRSHVCVKYEEDEWHISVSSPQGIMHGGRKLSELRLEQGDEFRLGPGGPYLRFLFSSTDTEHESTVNVVADQQMLLVLDTDKLTSEVTQITQGAYFQRLKSELGKLRSR